MDFYAKESPHFKKENNFLSPNMESDMDRESPVPKFGEEADMNHDEPAFQKNYKVKPHKEDLK
jgi:hypothetical protein